MIKLYKVLAKQVKYWEAWQSPNGRQVTIHWGTLGKTGRNKDVRVPKGETAGLLIENESEEPRSQGYAEIDIEDHSNLIVQFRTDDAWGDSADLDKRHTVEDILNECLGWTGNGHCDGGDIGSGTINAYSFVVDAKLARDTVIKALKKKGLLAGAIVAVDREDGYDVLWPDDFTGEFSIY